MASRKYVLKYGRKFSTSSGEVWTIPNGYDVYFALSPKMGCRGANTVVGFHKPGKELMPHKHSISEEILIIHSGKDECYPYDEWIPVETGGIVFALPGVPYDARNPTENTENFVTLGIATPPQFNLYSRTDYDMPEDNSGEYAEEI